MGTKVAAHAHGAEAIKRAIRAGVASVEHASLIDDEGIRLAKERGTYLVMDIYNDDYILAEYCDSGFPEKIMDEGTRRRPDSAREFPKGGTGGREARVRHRRRRVSARHEREAVRERSRMGLTAMQAIQTATVNAADLLGWCDKVGVVASRCRLRTSSRYRGDPLTGHLASSNASSS